MQLTNHLLSNKSKKSSQSIRFCPSPFFNERPQGKAGQISLLVIHNIALPPLTYGGNNIENLFSGRLNCQAHPYFAQLEGLEVSAHLLIKRTGEVIQFVPFNLRAWHAGISSFQGRSNCNDFSIGIELEGSDNQPFAANQYQQLIRVSQLLMANYPLISLGRICGHQDIAFGRKTDPGSYFNWQKFRCGLINK